MNRLRSILVLFSGCAMLAGLGCDQHVALGTLRADLQNLYWSATFEPGDLSEWVFDANGGLWYENAAPATVSTDLAHAGRYAGKPTMGPTMGAPGMASSSYFYRNQVPPSAYYAAWYYIPSTVTIHSWMSLAHFRSSTTGDDTNPTAIWDLNVWPVVEGSLPPGTLPVGTLTTHFYNYLTMTNADQLVTQAVPTDQWVHFEILLRKATDATGQVTVWQDNVMIVDLQNVPTVLTAWVQWDAGGASNDLSPATSSIYMDDASISLERLGNTTITDARAQP